MLSFSGSTFGEETSVWGTSLGRLLMDGFWTSSFDLALGTASELLFVNISLGWTLLSVLAQGGLIDECSGVLAGNSSGFVFVGCEGKGLTRGWTLSSSFFLLGNSALILLVLGDTF